MYAFVLLFVYLDWKLFVFGERAWRPDDRASASHCAGSVFVLCVCVGASVVDLLPLLSRWLLLDFKLFDMMRGNSK